MLSEDPFCCRSVSEKVMVQCKAMEVSYTYSSLRNGLFVRGNVWKFDKYCFLKYFLFNNILKYFFYINTLK